MLRQLRNKIGRHWTNIPGWKTDRRIVVFESDDWGAIRTSSENSLDKLAHAGIKIQNCHYLMNDGLASEQDLELLFNLLCSYKDRKGRNPAITANVILANPAFDKIKSSNYSEYHFELFTETLDKYPNHKNSFKLWKQGIQNKIFHPQFHGREHLQVMRWLAFLKYPNSATRKAFEEKMFGLSTVATSEKRKSFMAAYDWDNDKSRSFVLQSISEGLSIFESLFGYKSLTSIAPNYLWHEDVESILEKNGVKFIQGSAVQKLPANNKNGFRKKRHYTGQKNSCAQTYIVRNCKFEPTSSPDLDWVDKCMNEIKTAFYWNKPAIVEMHRVNFIGYINPSNRNRNLIEFDELLHRIINTWPEVEFMTSDELGAIIDKVEH